jgi:hypothetical protein
MRNNPKVTILRRTITATVILTLLILPTFAQKIQYPVTKKVDHTDTYFSVNVADPYRWLEKGLAWLIPLCPLD